MSVPNVRRCNAIAPSQPHEHAAGIASVLSLSVISGALRKGRTNCIRMLLHANCHAIAVPTQQGAFAVPRRQPGCDEIARDKATLWRDCPGLPVDRAKGGLKYGLS